MPCTASVTAIVIVLLMVNIVVMEGNVVKCDVV